MFNLSKMTAENPLPLSVSESSLSYILIDATLALTALVVGFVTALIYFRHTTPKCPEAEQDAQSKAEEAANAADRANMAAQRLGDLAKGMASDVTSHSDLMDVIAEELQESETSNSTDGVRGAIRKILDANTHLQDRLADAEQKILAQAAEIRSQQSEARTDSLTGLHNRRAFDSAVLEGIARYRENDTPFSLMMLDVDHFKKFNDLHGHQAGDAVLKSVGDTLKAVLKHNDLPCRYGGEEFAIVMPNTTAQKGRIAAGRVRNAIGLMNVQFEGKALSVTASVGVAEIMHDDEVRLIRRADDAVYASKEAGRNCGHWHDGETCLPLAMPSPNQPDAPRKNDIAEPLSPSSTNVAARLPDKSVFSSELRRRISESHRFGVPLSVMYLRVKDHHELVETYGEAVGDLVLDSVVTFIQSAQREMDLLGVYDVGEFVVMLPGSSEPEATQVGRRLRTAISQCELPLGDAQVKLAVDQGVTDVQPNDEAQSMIRRAIEFADSTAETAPLGA